MDTSIVIPLVGHLSDHDTITKVGDKIRKSKGSTIILDCTSLNFIDSHGLGMILYSYKILNESNQELILHNPSGILNELLTTANIDKIIRITHSS